MFYVYEWFIVETNEVFYVGKGCNRRYKVKKHNKFFNDMLKRYDCDSRIIKTFENEKDAFAYEYRRINELRDIGQCVCNIYNGGYGGTTDWWTDKLKEQYSKNNVMKSEKQRNRMKTTNPMKNPIIAEKTNGQKRRKVTVGNTCYISIKEAKEKLNVSYSNILTWAKKGITPWGDSCKIEAQKQYRQKSKIQGNQQPSQGNTDKSTLKGSETNG